MRTTKDVGEPLEGTNKIETAEKELSRIPLCANLKCKT